MLPTEELYRCILWFIRSWACPICTGRQKIDLIIWHSRFRDACNQRHSIHVLIAKDQPVFISMSPCPSSEPPGTAVHRRHHLFTARSAVRTGRWTIYEKCRKRGSYRRLEDTILQYGDLCSRTFIHVKSKLSGVTQSERSWRTKEWWRNIDEGFSSPPAQEFAISLRRKASSHCLFLRGAEAHSSWKNQEQAQDTYARTSSGVIVYNLLSQGYTIWC
jgi:hypothetical protein